MDRTTAHHATLSLFLVSRTSVVMSDRVWLPIARVDGICPSAFRTWPFSEVLPVPHAQRAISHRATNVQCFWRRRGVVMRSLSTHPIGAGETEFPRLHHWWPAQRFAAIPMPVVPRNPDHKPLQLAAVRHQDRHADEPFAGHPTAEMAATRNNRHDSGQSSKPETPSLRDFAAATPSLRGCVEGSNVCYSMRSRGETWAAPPAGMQMICACC